MLPYVINDIIFGYANVPYDIYLIDLKIMKLKRQKQCLLAKYKAKQIYNSFESGKEYYIMCSFYTDELGKMLKGKYTIQTHALNPILLNFPSISNKIETPQNKSKWLTEYLEHHNSAHTDPIMHVGYINEDNYIPSHFIKPDSMLYYKDYKKYHLIKYKWCKGPTYLKGKHWHAYITLRYLHIVFLKK